MTDKPKGSEAYEPIDDPPASSSVAPRLGSSASPRCQRCNFPVPDRAAGCKNPCPNCGTVYPLGDCSD